MPSHTTTTLALGVLVGTLLATCTFLALCRARLAENLLLRKQLRLFLERGDRPRRARNYERLWMVLLARLAPNWRAALVVVRPATLIRWHRNAWKILWNRKCRGAGRPPVPEALRALSRQLHLENPTWSADRIAHELFLKLGIQLSKNTVRKYLPHPHRGDSHRSDQRWSTFLRNHAKSVVACDFATAVTASFRTLHVFLVLELGSRRILHANVTASPHSDWTAQQLREAIPSDHGYQYLLHDRGSVFSPQADSTARGFGLTILRTPVRAPKANAHIERLIGTLRRECLDFLIPLSEPHLRAILQEWVRHYNRGRPHMALGPGVPEPSEEVPAQRQAHRHRLPIGSRVRSRSVLGGLHHEYFLEEAA